ncbi:hypothetical protein DACRYDRAFT_104882 [Dacryopinax primogenitus]|uniref:Uncharacterized protein n=1 Tax=Dacryopinax primogenitus (strain DJM 731) TaxID=1858805 RepID=M5G9N6_DACPD|nr:uncharacterized protein DACRYDRAFT_104882 [Dacryopinax primogenitus]EJU04990.1 hypothetical protein DACRYDRAFT_104882 [Dacryopinax primogenitus]
MEIQPSDSSTGLHGKHELREEIREQTVLGLRRLCENTGLTSGKWVFFVHRRSVTWVWKKIALSLVQGDLKETPAFAAKVSTINVGHTHIICLFLPDIFDKDAVGQVLDVLTTKVQVIPVVVKPDLYTYIGLYTKHPSGIRPSLWQVKDFVSPDSVTGLIGSSAVRCKSVTKKKQEPERQPDGLDCRMEDENAIEAYCSMNGLGPLRSWYPGSSSWQGKRGKNAASWHETDDEEQPNLNLARQSSDIVRVSWDESEIED